MPPLAAVVGAQWMLNWVELKTSACKRLVLLVVEWELDPRTFYLGLMFFFYSIPPLTLLSPPLTFWPWFEAHLRWLCPSSWDHLTIRDSSRGSFGFQWYMRSWGPRWKQKQGGGIRNWFMRAEIHSHTLPYTLFFLASIIFLASIGTGKQLL